MDNIYLYTSFFYVKIMISYNQSIYKNHTQSLLINLWGYITNHRFKGFVLLFQEEKSLSKYIAEK